MGMKLYGTNQGPHQPQWEENGFQESMRKLSVTGGEVYPERPGVPDCVYYMRTGFCGFTTRCRFNHPHDRASAMAASRLRGANYPERPGELPCQYYLKTGTCKFGAMCKFHHPRNGGESLTNAPLNYQGLPFQPGEKECSYYLQTGQCKYGRSCRYHHPQPAAAPPFYPTVQTPSSVIFPEQTPGLSPTYTAARPPLVPGSYVPGSYGHMLLSPGVVPVPGWGSYPGPVSPILSPGGQLTPTGGSAYGMTPLSPSTPALSGSYPCLPTSMGHSMNSTQEHNFPKRPGEPDCQYYLKTGSCKFGPSCKYHHPPDKGGSAVACLLGPLGLPLRLGTQPCTFYMQNGYCKFGTTCKFDHPLNMMKYNPPSAVSALSEIPLTPYMSGPTSATLPYELRPNYVIGPQSGNLVI